MISQSGGTQPHWDSTPIISGHTVDFQWHTQLIYRNIIDNGKYAILVITLNYFEIIKPIENPLYFFSCLVYFLCIKFLIYINKSAPVYWSLIFHQSILLQIPLFFSIVSFRMCPHSVAKHYIRTCVWTADARHLDFIFVIQFTCVACVTRARWPIIAKEVLKKREKIFRI